MSEDLITEKDIGREYIGKDGGVYEVLKYNPFYQFQFTVVRVDNDNGDIYKVNYNGEGSSVNNSFVKWRDESTTDYSDDFYNKFICAYAEATMGDDDHNKFKDKINKMSFRDLKPADIKEDEKDKQNPLGDLGVTNRLDSIIVDFTESLEDQERQRTNGKYELKITFSDINNNCKTDIFFYDRFSDLSHRVHSKTGITLECWTAHHSLTENKDDVFSMSRNVRFMDKVVGKVTVKITQLQD